MMRDATMSPSPPSSDRLSPAAAAFADYLARVEDGESVDFEDFCAEHSELRHSLQRIHEKWQTMSHAFAEYAESESTGEPDEVTQRRLGELAESTPPGGRYVKRGEIARGGMGSISEVWDRDLRRTIAMKTLLGDAAVPRMLARFLDEAQVTGQLDHPGVVPVHELGVDADGRVYFTMPLIRGQDLGAVIDIVHGRQSTSEGSGWSIARTLGVLVRVCEAMAYAHSKGVVHRDLKPANVMIGRFGETHVMDWGLARVMGEGSAVTSHRIDTVVEDERSALLTAEGDVVGTPVYMAPEQARGQLDLVGPRTDIYAVGAMLYEVLTGSAPYLSARAKASSHVILDRVRKGPPVALHALCPGLAPELIAICERAMARDPDARYGDMLGLAEDLRSYLEGRVVGAYETGAIARTRKWVKRNPWVAATGSVALLSLVAGLVVSANLANQARASAEHLARQVTAGNVERGRLFAATGNLSQAENLIWSEHLAGSDRSRTKWALWDLYSHQPCLATFRAHARDVRAAISIPGGAFVVSASSADGKIEVWDAATQQHVATVGDHGSPIMALAMSGDGKRVAAASRDGRISIWDVAERRLVRELVLAGASAQSLQFSPDRTALATGDNKHEVRLWNMTTGESTTVGRHEGSVNGIAFHPDGEILASTSADRTVRLWSLKRGHERALGTMLGPRQATGKVIFSPDGHRLFATSADRTIRMWDTGTRQSLGFLQADTGPLAASPDGNTLYVAGYWRIDCWDLRTNTIRRSFALTDIARSLHLDARRHVLISGHNDGTIRLWDLQSDRSVRTLADHEGRVAAVCSRDGLIATGDSAGALRLWDPRDGDVRRLAGSKARIKSLAFSPDGALLAVGDIAASLRILSCEDGTLLHRIGAHDSSSLQSVIFSPEGKTIAMAARGGRIQLIDVASGRITTQWQVDTRQVINLAFDPDGSLLASTDRSGRVRVWSRAGRLLHEYLLPESPWSLTFSPDGKKLVCGTWATKIFVLDVASGRIEKRLLGHSGAVWCVTFSPRDENVFASVSADQTARLWDLRAGQTTVTLRGGDLAVSFSADGRTLTTGAFDRRVSVWDLDYFRRHVAGNLLYQLSRFAGRAAGVEELERGRRRTLARPWPR